MASKEFDVDQLAAYLHLTPEKVMKLASQGSFLGGALGETGDFQNRRFTIGSSTRLELVIRLS